LDIVNASYQTPYGLVKSNWRKHDRQLDWSITIPANSKAIVYLPVNSISGIREGGKRISVASGFKYLGQDKGEAKIEIGSGDYHFAASNYFE